MQVSVFWRLTHSKYNIKHVLCNVKLYSSMRYSICLFNREVAMEQGVRCVLWQKEK